ncbi:hypothetical protein [Prevotella corporis]|uniref:Uncharacterized protein n=1 Tax=Prevotella corporis TaxID=28128 RepID=A0A133PTV1_9BACT|nr:hypothetical protein [Prevotella corporis]KXA32507.1 hypothetical protein HMPREF3226_02748 [Prevotella corporis]
MNVEVGKHRTRSAGMLNLGNNILQISVQRLATEMQWLIHNNEINEQMALNQNGSLDRIYSIDY